MSTYINFRDIVIYTIILYFLYKGFFKASKKYNDYIYRSIGYGMIFKKSKEIEILLQGLKDDRLTKYNMYGLLINISSLYYSKKDYANAITHFEKGMNIIYNEEFCFDKYYIKMLGCYILQGQKEKAIDLYNNLVPRQRYDIKFRKLETNFKFLDNLEKR
ncbi:tetratricopeptide repeat protein [Clostridium sp. HMP27]|uniref:tetratricopeptide repeat protein n=1 Tax=Clostridium sp. HMP27 TaxID=1487921 RepID=UPI00052C2185|nr:tetratricopeptide repeat protein [Clostridium sp. HMP27]KGK87477.1 hypothetical protein DP68_09245 [Clostridium sp. HMP27]